MRLALLIFVLIFCNIMICNQLRDIEEAIIDSDFEKVERFLLEHPLTAAQQNGFLDLSQQWIKNAKQVYKRFIIFECRHSIWPFITGFAAVYCGGGLLCVFGPILKRIEIAALGSLIVGGIGLWMLGYKKVITERERILAERLKTYFDALRIKQLIYQAKVIG